MARKKLQNKPKSDKTRPAKRPAESLAELPGEIHHARAQIADAPETLRHLADALEPAIHEFFANDHPDQIRASATQIRANVVAAAGVLLDLAVFSGRLEGLAWWERGRSGVGGCDE